METIKPTGSSFAFRFLFMVVIGSSMSAIVIMSFYRYTLHATAADQKIITLHGFPITLSGILLYSAVILLIALPLISFLRSVGRGESMEEGVVYYVQDQALNLGPKMAVLAGIFYTLITPIILYRGIRELGWPVEMTWYGVFSGSIAGFLMIPLSLHVANWVVRPILNYTTYISAEQRTSRRGGVKISLRNKLLVTFLPLIIALLFFASMIGYSQTQTILNNMEIMQNNFVRPGEGDVLVDNVNHRTDPGIRSAAFFRARLGNLKYFYGIMIACAMIFSLLITMFSSSEITQPVRVLGAAADRIRDGNFDEPVRLVNNDEMSELGESVNSMIVTITGQIKSMSSLVSTMKEGINQLDASVKTILAISREQSTGATQQASAVQEALSIAEEITASSRQIAGRADNMDGISTSTMKACEDGGNRLGAAREDFMEIAQQSNAILETMKDLEGSFKKTYMIVKWIEDIAEQTEMLALNASLEAAGAGEEGRRFTVVAEATRRLAHRAVRSTRDIKEVLESIHEATMKSTSIAETGREKVFQGAEAIEKAVQAINNISRLAQSTSSQVHEINLSTNQQSTASEQLAVSFSEVSEVARKAEVGAKEIEAAIAQLRSFSEELHQMVERETERLKVG